MVLVPGHTQVNDYAIPSFFCLLTVSQILRKKNLLLRSHKITRWGHGKI